MTGIGSHQSARMMQDEWLTPPHIIAELGPFDLDPCAPIQRPWPMATHHYTMQEDGLRHEWVGRVWCNPPYGRETRKWLARCAQHGNAIALIFARTETALFREYVWGAADSLLFLDGRLHFHHVDGSRAKANSGAPSVLVAYGSVNAERLAACKLRGAYIENWREAA